MENQEEIKNSYFINKRIIKNKVKENINKIGWYQEVINTIVRNNKYITKLDNHDKKFIEICEEIITEYKKKILKNTHIYFYG